MLISSSVTLGKSGHVRSEEDVSIQNPLPEAEELGWRDPYPGRPMVNSQIESIKKKNGLEGVADKKESSILLPSQT